MWVFFSCNVTANAIDDFILLTKIGGYFAFNVCDFDDENLGIRAKLNELE